MAKLEQIYRQNWYQTYDQRRLAGTEGEGGSRTAWEKEHRHTESLRTLRWALARESQVRLADKHSHDVFIQLFVNPSECVWKQGTRTANEKTHGGMVNHEYPAGNDPANLSRFDLPTVQIAFQSGSLVRGSYAHSDSDIQDPMVVTHGADNFVDFMELLDQPNTLDDGSPNYVNIFYISPTFSGQNGIWLKGFFDDSGVSFTDSADNPYVVMNWSASFTVFESNPPLSKLRNAFKALPSPPAPAPKNKRR